MINERDPHKHSEMKRKLSHGFSAKALLEQEDIVQGYVDKLIGQINVHGTRPEGDEMVKWYNFFTFDLIGDLAFGQSFGSLNDGMSKPHFWVSLLLGNVRAIAWRSVARWFPVFEKLGVWTVPKRVMEMRIKHSEYSRKMIVQQVPPLEQTWAESANLLSKTNEFEDYSQGFAFRTVRPRRPGHDYPRIIWPGQHNHVPSLFLRALPECLATAGSETTATFLSGTTYHLLKNPRVYNLLAEEIRSAYNTYDEITDANASKLKYLSAVIDEGLRIYPPVGTGTYRESPGETVDGIYIPKGVELSTSPWSTCHSPENFHDHEVFKPERWLDPACTDKKHASQPFSLGSRVCIGRNLALKEIRLALSKIFWVYEMELVNRGVDLNRDSTSFVLWDKPDLWVRFTRRPGVRVPVLDSE
ncbi:unnamed protein product [Tuber aestivum]|uniref:Cytochrome P450 n=1 Tax=Tuber aestivum TaxID=59557 RepID=A0A292PY47_9PEZI|nr:unnamed protein product [Tuber aestivum]